MAFLKYSRSSIYSIGKFSTVFNSNLSSGLSLQVQKTLANRGSPRFLSTSARSTSNMLKPAGIISVFTENAFNPPAPVVSLPRFLASFFVLAQ
jgi:hypothetical protein